MFSALTVLQHLPENKWSLLCPSNAALNPSFCFGCFVHVTNSTCLNQNLMKEIKSRDETFWFGSWMQSMKIDKQIHCKGNTEWIWWQHLLKCLSSLHKHGLKWWPTWIRIGKMWVPRRSVFVFLSCWSINSYLEQKALKAIWAKMQLELQNIQQECHPKLFGAF